MAAGDVWEASFETANEGGSFVNVLHYEENTNSSGTLESTGTALAESLANDMSSVWMNVVSNDTQQVCVHVTRISPEGSRVFSSYTGSGSKGTRPLDCVSAQVAAIISKYTEDNTRTGRGRMYIGGLSEADVKDGALVAEGLGDVVENLKALASLFLLNAYTDNEGNTYTPSLWSRKNKVAKDIIAAVVKPVVGVIRGRREPNRPFQ